MPTDAMDQVAVRMPTDSASRSRRATYTRQLRRKFQSNDADWQATIATIRSFDTSRKLAEEQKLWESFMLLLAVIGIVCVSVEGELLGVELEQLVQEGREFTSAAETDSLSYSIVFIVLKGVLSGTSGLLLFALIMRYRIVCKIKVLAKQLPPGATFFSAYSGLRSQFLLEALVCTFHMPLLSAERHIWRWEEYDVLCLDQLDVMVFARVYLLGRVLRNQFGLNSSSHEARLIGSIHQVNVSSIWLTVKFSFQKFPFESTLMLLGIDWFLTSAALNFFERASNPTETNASDAFWLTIVTITGVGYGDAFPWTLGGKIVIAIGGIIGGMVIACLLRVVLIDTLQMTPQEQTVLDVARFYRYIRQRKESAAMLVQQAWRWHRAKRATSRQARNQKVRMYAAAEAFRLLRFARPPSLAGDINSNPLQSPLHPRARLADIVAKRVENLQANIASRRTQSCKELEQTATLFQKIAQSSFFTRHSFHTSQIRSQPLMYHRGAPMLLRRCLSSVRRVKGLNLTPYVSPLLLRLHPDTVQRQAPTLAQENEQALKQLNVFLELATSGCNNDAFNARKQVLALIESRHAVAEEPVRFPLLFHVPVDDLDHGDAFLEVKYTVEVPGRLVKRTLTNAGHSPSVRTDPEAALQAPFAREWQRTTKRILQDLFEVAQVPLVVEEEDETKTTALAEWLAEEDTVADQVDKHGIRAAEQNKARKKEHEQFDKLFHAMLTHEKNIVQETTTGLEDGPTTQHAVLTNLLQSRLFLPKFSDPHMKKSAYHWIANFLLINFMELRLHSLVWNKITLLVTADADVEEPQVSWDEEAPEQGMGILIPVGMDADTLIDFIYEHVEDLEFALEEKSTHAQATAKKEHQRLRQEKKKGKRRRQGHFYQDEVNTIFRK